MDSRGKRPSLIIPAHRAAFSTSPSSVAHPPLFLGCPFSSAAAAAAAISEPPRCAPHARSAWPKAHFMSAVDCKLRAEPRQPLPAQQNQHRSPAFRSLHLFSLKNTKLFPPSLGCSRQQPGFGNPWAARGGFSCSSACPVHAGWRVGGHLVRCHRCAGVTGRARTGGAAPRCCQRAAVQLTPMAV